VSDKSAKVVLRGTIFSVRHTSIRNHILQYSLGQALPLRQPSSERLDKSLIALAAFGLRALAYDSGGLNISGH
jgi:hypothetical protein